MITSKLTSKSQTTVPRPVRKALDLHPGDQLTYEIRDGDVVLGKDDQSEGREDPITTFSEWNNPEDEKAYADL